MALYRSLLLRETREDEATSLDRETSLHLHWQTITSIEEILPKTMNSTIVRDGRPENPSTRNKVRECNFVLLLMNF